MRYRWRSRAGSVPSRPDSGAVAVEFALIFGFMLVPLMMGLLQYGWYFYTSQITASATRETARRLSVGDCQGAGQAQVYARQSSGLTSLTLSYGSTTSQNNTLPPAGQVLRVTANLDAVLFEFLPMPNNGLIQRRVDARVEDTLADSTC